MLQFPKRESKYGVQIPLTSLIDIVFLLLIYFLLTTNFLVDEGIKVNLPKAKAAADALHTEITIHLEKDGTIYLDQIAATIPDLLNRLRENLAAGMDPVVIVKADKTIIVDRVVEVMDIVKAAGVEKILLATERTF